MKVGDVLVHDWTRHVVLIVRKSSNWIGRDGSTLYEALVLEAGQFWCKPGDVMVLSPEQPFYPLLVQI